jgi:hypothetical protein
LVRDEWAICPALLSEGMNYNNNNNNNNNNNSNKDVTVELKGWESSLIVNIF